MEYAVQAIMYVSFVKFGAGRGKRQSTSDKYYNAFLIYLK